MVLSWLTTHFFLLIIGASPVAFSKTATANQSFYHEIKFIIF